MLSEALQRASKKRGVDYLATTRKEVDITNSDALKSQFETLEFTHVVNCSGYTAVDRAEEEREKAEKLNVHAVETLAILAKKKGAKLIHFSTDYVFDGEQEAPYCEEAAPAPLSIYGQTKRGGEEKILAHYPEACIIRSSWLFGREGNHFVKTIVQLMEQHDFLRIVADQRGRPTFSDDLADAALDLLNHQGIYHFANSGEATWLEFAEEILKLLKEKKIPVRCGQLAPITSKEYGSKASRPAFSVLETKKYETLMNKKPRGWKECLKEYFETVQ